jgi:hypothetical protein
LKSLIQSQEVSKGQISPSSPGNIGPSQCC